MKAMNGVVLLSQRSSVNHLHELAEKLVKPFVYAKKSSWPDTEIY